MKKLADGNTAEIFEWDDTRILKLWRSHYPPSDVDNEARIGQMIATSTLPVPRIYDVVEQDNRRGIIYERVRGVSLLDWIFEDFSRFEAGARWLGRLQAMIHNHAPLSDLPRQRERLIGQITRANGVSDTIRATALARLDVLPDDDKICHGDFHPQNVLVAGDKATIIDWMDGTRGSAIADVTRTLLLVDGGDQPAEITAMFKSFYLDEYAQHRPLDVDLITRWYPILALARLSESLPQSETDRLIQIVRDSQ
ncbi:MAG: phosphotransferase [Anaerolineae bacterium]|nr:phosphotransferase [Anaerolineae bacterium]